MVAPEPSVDLGLRLLPFDLESKSQFLGECLARVLALETQAVARNARQMKGTKIPAEFESREVMC